MNGELIHIVNTVMMLKYSLITGEFIVPTENSRYDPAVFSHIQPDYTSPDIRYWLVQLRNKREVQDIKLLLSGAENPMFAGFSGAIPTGMVTRYSDRTTLWTSAWSMDNEQKKWQVSYSESKSKDLSGLPQGENPCKQYRRVLEDIAALAYKINGAYWAKNYFEQAIEYLNGKPPCEHSNFILHDLMPTENRSMLCAASAAWVFGGMGSWNDLCVSDDALQKEYTRLSSELYKNILQMMMFAVNTWQ